MSVSKPLIVSIHDVRPRLFEEVRQMLQILAREGIETTSLLVIPNFHREEPLQNYPAIIENLKQLQSQGHELMLHALYHREEPLPKHEKIYDYIVAHHYTNGEGEFFRIDQTNARERIAAGLQLFQQLGFNNSGFTAPAWLYSEGALAALRELQIAYHTTLWGIGRLQGSFIPARAIVWSHRAAWRRWISNTWLPGIAQRIMQRQGILRIALHPPDFRYAEIRQCALNIIRQALQQGYRPTTYRDLVMSP